MQYRHVRRSRVALSAYVSFLLVISLISPLVFTNSARGLTQSPGNGPRAGAPEGVLPGLDEAKNRPVVRPSAPPSISSTMRSRRNPLVPRNGRRVGDPLPIASPLPSPSPLPSRVANVPERKNIHSNEVPATRTSRAASHAHHASPSARTTAVTPQGAPPIFTDPDLLAPDVRIKALHITELRTAINDLRAQRGFSAYSWQASVTGLVKADPILEMRPALDQVLGPPPSPGYNSALAQFQPILAVHIQELRDRVIDTLNVTVDTDLYLRNFHQWVFLRQPYADESNYWNDIFRAAYQNGQGSLDLAMRELGKTLFESSEYAARNRSDSDYVYDLYRTYLVRQPDPQGWDSWTAAVPLYGREQVRRGFDESAEFLNIMSTMTANGSVTSGVSSLSSARVGPENQPGNGLLARAAEWSLPLLSLPGRAGLDLGLSLSYSSMVWTRSGPYLYFDEDIGFPSPGFRLGFPAIQEKFFDAQVGKNVYVLLTSGGRRVELRQAGSSNIYEAGDSSYLQLIDNGTLLVRSTDGTQLSYGWFNHEFRCTEIKDRNGNYITVNYNWLGHITTVTDTLGRTITFNYDPNANLISITQTWAGQPFPHPWATFVWATKTLQPSFADVMVVGANPSTVPVLSQVGLDDGSRHTFEYSSAGQVSIIKRFALPSDSTPRASTAYDYQYSADDCPRLSGTRVSAENWTGINGVPQEVETLFGAPGDGSHTMTTPDGTLYKEFYGTGWQRGLPTQTEVWSGEVRQKWTSNTWTQDNTGVTYQTNPRVTETNVNDGNNHRRVTTTYTTSTLPSGESCSLPSDTREYAADASTVLRRTHVDYWMDPVADASYLSRHIIGLVKEQTLYEIVGGVETLMSKVGFGYDEASSQGTDAPVRHDNDNYSATFIIGRANLSSVKRYDVINSGQWTVSSMQYNTSGSVVSTTDPLSHSTTISYGDSFSDGNNNATYLLTQKR